MGPSESDRTHQMSCGTRKTVFLSFAAGSACERTWRILVRVYEQSCRKNQAFPGLRVLKSFIPESSSLKILQPSGLCVDIELT